MGQQILTIQILRWKGRVNALLQLKFCGLAIHHHLLNSHVSSMQPCKRRNDDYRLIIEPRDCLAVWQCDSRDQNIRKQQRHRALHCTAHIIVCFARCEQGDAGWSGLLALLTYSKLSQRAGELQACPPAVRKVDFKGDHTLLGGFFGMMGENYVSP